MYKLIITDKVYTNNSYSLSKPYKIGVLETLAVCYGEDQVDNHLLNLLKGEVVEFDVPDYGKIGVQILSGG